MSSDLYRIYLSQTHRLTLVPMLQMWIDNSRKVPSAGPGKNPATSPTNPETTSGLGWMRRRHWLEQVPSGNCLSCPKHRSPGPPLKDEAHDLCLLTWNLEKWQCKCEFECECVCVCHGNAPISKAFWKVVWPAARARPDSAIYPSSNNSLSGHKSGLNLNHQCDSSQPVRWGSTSSHARYMLGLCAVCANRLKHTSPVEVPRLVPKSSSKGTKEAKKTRFRNSCGVYRPPSGDSCAW